MTGGDTLVVIEAPGKAEALRALLRQIGLRAEVFATRGHLCRHPETLFPLGITEHLRETTRRFDPVRLGDLQRMAEGRQVFVATDADAEGDVIARDVADAVGGRASAVSRVRLGALDLRSVRAAFEAATPPRARASRSGDARRILDRLIGHAFSGPDRPVGRVMAALLGFFRRQEPVIGHVTLLLPAADGGRPFQARVSITPSSRAVWERRLAESAQWRGVAVAGAAMHRTMPLDHGRLLLTAMGRPT